MLVFYYLTRLFWLRVIGLLLGCISILTTFELLSRSPMHSYADIFYKIPFSVHKMLPFITFVSMLMFTWRLMRQNEWAGLASMGRSPTQIIGIPLISVVLLGFLDMGVIVPLGQRFFNPFQNKASPISLHSAGWKKGITPSGYLFFRADTDTQHVLEFSKNSSFVQHLIAKKTMVQDRTILCTDLWNIHAHASPQHQKECAIDLAEPIDWDEKNEHPLLLSLSQVNTAMEKSTPPSLLLSARWHYWWSHFFWSLSLVPLAPALLLGQSSRYWKMLWAGCGILGCLTLYLIKEWLYAISIPLAHSWPSFLLWIPCAITLCVSWIILFEKNEL